MRLSILGKPGSGKSGVADCLSRSFGVPTISSGALIRLAIKQCTELGLIADEYVRRGDLLPEGLVDQLIVDRLREDDVSDGWILDGYPRRRSEAENLANMGHDGALDVLIHLGISDSRAEQRLLGRSTCIICGAQYGLDAPPRNPSVCDRCGGSLARRAEDDRVTIRHRLQVFALETEPVLGYYKRALITVDASKRRDEVCADARDAATAKLMAS